MKTILVDIDGTLSNPEHRLHYVQDGNRHWNDFFAEMHLDTVNEEIAELTRIFYNDAMYKVVIVTARPANYMEVTKQWLADNDIFYDAIFMRPENDTRQDSVVKAEILQKILDYGYEPWLVIDDRDQVVAMWRDHGICTLQCAPDSTSSKYAGETLLHMMVGPSGAGKSTYIEKNYKPEDVISTDAIRTQLFGNFGDGVQTAAHHARVFKYAHDLINTRLKNGVFTVFDATNIRDRDRKEVLKAVPKGQIVQYVIIDREFDEKLKTRGWRSEELVKRHHNTFKSNIKNILAGDHQSNVYVLDAREHKI